MSISIALVSPNFAKVQLDTLNKNKRLNARIFVIKLSAIFYCFDFNITRIVCMYARCHQSVKQRIAQQHFAQVSIVNVQVNPPKYCKTG